MIIAIHLFDVNHPKNPPIIKAEAIHTEGIEAMILRASSGIDVALRLSSIGEGNSAVTFSFRCCSTDILDL